jgi:formiminotetrahydrofolate cyclodeaminase
MIKDQSIHEFLEALASKAATPGGGSAAAVMGAMGAALVCMVCNLTLGKKGYEAAEGEIQALLARAEALRERLADMVRADVEVFAEVMAAYGLPKDSEAEKAARGDAIQLALKAATEVPLDCVRLCAEVVMLSKSVAEKGNKNVISDAGVAVLASYAALRSAALNVYINAAAIKDRTFVEERVGELDRILYGMEALTEEVYQLVKTKL